jgi:shikimate kinase/3-dehydroquinate synthase
MNKNQNQFGIIAIVGLMGVGKTTIGAKLAERLQCYFIDSDQEIEDIEQQTIPEIFAKKGEKYFREIEKNLIKEVVKRDEDIVLSLGGGAFVDDEVRALLKEKATTIWLCADIDDILIRVSGKTNRPLLQTTDKRATLEDLARKRYPLYSEAHLKFDTSAETHEVVIRKIIQNLNDVTRQREKSVIAQKVAVALEERSYDILVGNKSLRNLADFLQKKSYSKIITITDENVAKHHLARLEDVLAMAEKSCETIIVKAGEQTKSFHFLEKICEEILAKNIDRKSLIIAFGGGVIGDLSGFIASILLRGIDFVQIPTTLLSMVDSSVGGKTAINSRSGKNLIGSFYQPKLVICDLNFLKTLPARELKSGYAEVVKYGFIYDKNFFTNFWNQRIYKKL